MQKKLRLKCLLPGLFVLTGIFSSALQAQIPNGYYDSANGLSGEQLRNALHNIIDNHNEFSYDYAKTILKESDEDPNNSNNVILLYTGRSQAKSSFGGGANDWNREHVWAKSHGDFGTSKPAGTDCHHLRPTDASVNSSRSNKDFDEGGTYHSEATECRSTSNSWEPRDAVKGDVARMMFYMAIRYEGDASGEPDLELVDYNTNATSQPLFGVLSTLLRWHNEDPVDDFERNRNDVVYSYQNNRNPFIDHPEYVSRIWNSNEAAAITQIIQTPAEPNENDVVTVSANVTDAEGVNTVSLQWSLAEDDLANTISMTNTAGNIYQTTTAIPAQSIATKVFYNIVVIDNDDQSTVSNMQSYTIPGVIPSGVLLNEDFETVTDQEDLSLVNWTNYKELGTRYWQGREYNNNSYAQFTSYGSGEENEAWLVTPVVDLSTVVNANFSFDVNVGYWKHNGLQVLASTNYNGSDVTAATWTDITSSFTIPTEPTNAYGNFASAGAFALNAYSGDFCIAFKYTGNENSGNTTTYQIDNVLIEGDIITSNTDTIAPVLSFIPANSNVDIAVTTSIKINANEALRTNGGNLIDNAYLQAVVSLNKDSENGSDVAFTGTINGANTEITLVPTQVLESGTEYYLSIAENTIQDTANNKITTKQTVQFTTENAADIYPPAYLLSRLSVDYKVVKFIFNENLVNNFSTYSLLKDNIEIKTNQADYVSLNPADEVLLSGDTLIITLNTELNSATNIFKIKANSLKDEIGNVLDEDVLSDVFDASGTDTLEPEFLLGYPIISEVSSNGFKCTFKTDEAAKVFYKLQEAGNVPTIQEMLAEDYIEIADANSEMHLVFSQLNDYTNYSLYIVAQDVLPEPNTSKSVKYMAVRTKAIAPEIVENPVSRVVCKGANTQLWVKADGTEPIYYQWFVNNMPIQGAENDTLDVLNFDENLVGSYYCEISNLAGSLNSVNANLSLQARNWAGADSTFTLFDTVMQVNLFDYLPGITDYSGTWIDVDQTQASQENILRPGLAGIGNFEFLYIVTDKCGSDTAIVNIEIKQVPVGFVQSELLTLKLYPNPSHGKFVLISNIDIETKRLKIYGVDGSSVPFQCSISDKQINISIEQKQGIYLLKYDTYCERIIIR